MHVQRETRAEGFLDDYVEPIERKGAHENMTESAELSQLISRLNQLSARSKIVPVTVEHLVVFAETIIMMLDRVLAEIEDLKKSRRHGL